jgi:phosphoribosyl-ATP pyrophosphohydrolase
MSSQRLNFTLPDDVVKILNKKAKDGEKSAFVAEAIRQHSKPKMTKKLIEELIEGYTSRAADDLKMAQEMESTLSDGIDDETW